MKYPMIEQETLTTEKSILMLHLMFLSVAKLLLSNGPLQSDPNYRET